MSITYADLCHAVADVFRNRDGIKRVEAFDQIQEKVSVYPTLHIMPDAIEVDDSNEKTDRTTFGAGVRVTKMRIAIDGYARPRSHLAADLKEQIALLDIIDGILSEQVDTLYGSAYIRAHRWSAEVGLLPYGDTNYSGVKFTLTLTIY